MPDGNQKLSFTIGTGAAIQPNSVELSIPVSDALNTIAGMFTLFDVPINSSIGNLVTSTGNIQGAINYTTGAVEVTPVLIQKTIYSSLHTIKYVHFCVSEIICLFIYRKPQESMVLKLL